MMVCQNSRTYSVYEVQLGNSGFTDKNQNASPHIRFRTRKMSPLLPKFEFKERIGSMRRLRIISDVCGLFGEPKGGLSSPCKWR
jgi:hypothetical protein